MKLSKVIFLIFLLLSIKLFAVGDDSVEKKSYYMFPIMPGKTNYLAGTMGELRSSHFHGGIDIKTQGREGLNVYSAADGYVSRVKVSSGGYGNALYITHPNGETTVYAHLLQFEKSLANWVRKKQYETQSFNVDLWPGKDEFQFKQGDVVALSGNTGGSSGPHLHFEIRDRNQRPINPLHYQFNEIRDNIAPIVQKLAIECLDPESRVNDRFGRFEFTVLRKGSNYFLDQPIQIHGKVGVEILAHDKLNGAGNKNGVPDISMELDGHKVYEQNLSSFSFAESRNILVHTNYRIKYFTGRSYNRLYISSGDELGFYNRDLGNGIINMQDDTTHYVKISLSDAYDNESCLNFEIKGSSKKEEVVVHDLPEIKNNPSRLFNNSIIITKNLERDPSVIIELYSDRVKHNLEPAYVEGNMGVYVWDLNKGLPDSVDLCYMTERFNFKVSIPPNHSFNYYNSSADIYFPKKSLFDTLFFQLNHKIDTVPKAREYFSLHPTTSPLRQNISITLKPSLDYPKKDKTHVYKTNGGRSFSFTGGVWEKNTLKFKSRDMGTYTILEDTISPQIRVIRLNKDMTSFVIKDELSGIGKIDAFINDQWVLMNYDYKKNLIWSEKIDNNIAFTGEFKLVIRDNAGNEKIYKTNL